jgi:hypothetical protein
MEVPFTADQEAQLARMATKSGTDAPHLVKDAALRLLDEEAAFSPPSKRELRQPIAASLSKKKRWTPALSACLSLDAYPLDRSRRRRFGEHQKLS